MGRPGDDPYVIPVNYTVIDGEVVFRTQRRPVIDAIYGRPASGTVSSASPDVLTGRLLRGELPPRPPGNAGYL